MNQRKPLPQKLVTNLLLSEFFFQLEEKTRGISQITIKYKYYFFHQRFFLSMVGVIEARFLFIMFPVELNKTRMIHRLIKSLINNQ